MSSSLFDNWTRDYALLGLRMDRLAPGTVDAWTGPPDWREGVLQEPPPAAHSLRANAEDLLLRLAPMGYAPVRAAFLERQVRALHAGLRMLEGQEIGLTEQAMLFFDIQVEPVPEATFAEAHEELEKLLPGTGTLGERMAALRRQFEAKPEQLGAVLEKIVAELRARTTAHLALPAEEDIALSFVQNQPWGAYNWYLGGARSRIEINTDLPLRANSLVEYLAHEGYPGHHTEHALREMRQYRAGGQGEYAIQLINTPECVISEAIATSACALVFPDEEDLAWTASEVLPMLGMHMDVAQAMGISKASSQLRWVNGNAAHWLHEEGRPAEEVAQYVERWALRTPAEALKTLEFLSAPLWRAYSFTYSYGRTLLEPLLKGADRFALFERLCSEPVYPSLLKEWAGEKARERRFDG